jgi:hypothetical protein
MSSFTKSDAPRYEATRLFIAADVVQRDAAAGARTESTTARSLCIRRAIGLDHLEHHALAKISASSIATIADARFRRRRSTLPPSRSRRDGATSVIDASRIAERRRVAQLANAAPARRVEEESAAPCDHPPIRARTPCPVCTPFRFVRAHDRLENARESLDLSIEQPLRRPPLPQLANRRTANVFDVEIRAAVLRRSVSALSSVKQIDQIEHQRFGMVRWVPVAIAPLAVCA